MIVVRVARGISEHFPARASEWGFSGLLIGLGYVFASSPELFADSRSYSGLARVADETLWGNGCIMIGLVRLLALIVNGTFADSIYARWSPHVRGVCAFLSCGIWFPLWAGFFAVSGAPIVKLFTFTVLAIDAYNVRRVWVDAGRTSKAYADADQS